MVATIVYSDRRKAIVRKFNKGSKAGYGIAQDTSTGELIYFNMSNCRTFMCGDSYPVFTDELKRIEPKKGDALTFILDSRPVQKDKRPNMLFWNYEESYQQCLADCRKQPTETDQIVDASVRAHQQPLIHTGEHTQMTATNGHMNGHGHNSKRPRKHCRTDRNDARKQVPGPENNWGYGSVAPKPKVAPETNINLVKELSRR